jgi:hypothetical protein
MKKIKLPEKKAGIWLDQEKAYIIRMEGEGEPVMEKIKSDVESRIRYAGEGKVSARFGHSFIDDQEKKQKRQRHQRRRYFKEIIGHIHDADYIYLFGPGEAKEELNNAIEDDQTIKGKVVAIATVDRLTQKQMIVKMKDYFNDEPFRVLKKKLSKNRHEPV